MDIPILRLLVVFGVLIGLPVEAQTLPVTTTSELARAHFESGRTAAHHYQFAEARAHLDSALVLDSTFVLAHLHRGGSADLLSELQHHLALAAAHRERASDGERQMIEAFHAFLLERNYPRAVEIFSRLSAEYPDDPYLPAYLGLRYYRNLRQYEQAAEQFRTALARDSSFVQAYNWLGYIAMDQGDEATAEETFRRYIQLAPDQPRPYNSLGVLYLRQHKYEEAARLFEQSYARDPRFSESRSNLVRARIAQQYRVFQEAVRRRDAAALAALYTADGQLLPAGNEVVEGTDAIRRFWQGAFDAGVNDVELRTTELYLGLDGNTATEVGRYRLTADRREQDVGKYVVVWERTSDGWKLHRDIWTSDRPAQ